MCCIWLNQTEKESLYIKSKCPQSETLSFNMGVWLGGGAVERERETGRLALKPEEEASNPLFLPAPCWDDSTTKITLAQS